MSVTSGAESVAAATRVISASRPTKLGSRIDLLPGDAVHIAWPAGQDVVLLSYLLSALGDAEIDVVLAKAQACLAPDGLLIVHDFMLDDEAPGPALAALWFLQYLACRSDGVSFSTDTLAGRLREHGFTPAASEVHPRDDQDDPGRKGIDMKLAVGLTPMETRRDVVLHVATRAESLGYDAFFVAEGWGHDASVLLTEVATRTSRIRIGTGVLNIWGRSAAQIAMLAASLHEVSEGRFVLGLGAGSPTLAEGLHDVEFRAPVPRLAAMTREVRALLEGERVSRASGSRGLRLATAPAPVPISLAALGPAAIRVCGEVADSWAPFLFPVSALKDGIRVLEHGAAGRPRPQVCPAVPAAVSPDPDHARALASWWVEFYLTRMGPLYPTRLRQLGFTATVDEVVARTGHIPETLLDELTLWGDAATAQTGLEHLYAAGADMPILTLPPNRSIEELDHILLALAPRGRDAQARIRAE